MRVFEDRMIRNLDSSRGLIFSESILIKLVDKGLTRGTRVPFDAEKRYASLGERFKVQGCPT